MSVGSRPGFSGIGNTQSDLSTLHHLAVAVGQTDTLFHKPRLTFGYFRQTQCFTVLHMFYLLLIFTLVQRARCAE